MLKNAASGSIDHTRQAGSNGTQSEHTVKSITSSQVAASPRLPGRLYAGSSISSPGHERPRAISISQRGTTVVVVVTELVVTTDVVVTPIVLDVVVSSLLVVVEVMMLEVVVGGILVVVDVMMLEEVVGGILVVVDDVTHEVVVGLMLEVDGSTEVVQLGQ
jgi:hypothetical protein